MTVEDFLNLCAKPYDANDNYSRSPYMGDVISGKNEPFYNVHSYHTKVPPKGIIGYIEHYTEPGDMVLDPFCGSGMTGVAALTCPSGRRQAILNDLSPAAGHIAFNYCTPVDIPKLESAFERISNSVRKDFDWLYGTTCHECGSPATVLYTVWSDVFKCDCGYEFTLWNVGVDHNSGKVMDSFYCPQCGVRQTKKQLARLRSDPVIVNFLCSKIKCGRHERSMTLEDMERKREIEGRPIPYWYPTDEFPNGRQTRKLRRGKAGISRVDQIFTWRNLWALARLWEECNNEPDKEVSDKLKFAFTAVLQRSSKLNRLRPSGAGDPLSGTLYVPSLIREDNVLETIAKKVKAISICSTLPEHGTLVKVGSATSLKLRADLVDYIFTDPPYGESLQYAELNFLWESWLRQFTPIAQDCVMNYVHHKGLSFYSGKMQEAFTEMHRVLKPNHWASVVFHNTDDHIWAAIQSAAQCAGFEVVTALAFDKRQGTFNRVNMGKDNAAGFDIVLNLHKRPQMNGIARELVDIDSLVLDSIGSHLRTDPSPEHRTVQFLHSLSIRTLLNANVKVERVTIPYLDTLLPQCGFKQVDSRWYLRGEEIRRARLALDVEDETSAIDWLRNRLQQRPETRGEIDPHWKIATLNVRLGKSLDEILEENFCLDELTNRWRLPTDEERARMEDAASHAMERALRRLVNDIEARRAISSKPDSATLAQWIHRSVEQKRWKDVLLLFPLLDHAEFAEEDWWELQQLQSFAQQQSDKFSEASEEGPNKAKTLPLPFPDSNA